MIGVDLPHIGVQPPDPAELASFIRTAEEAGFGSIWTMEGHLGPAHMLDPLATLAFAAGITTRIRLGVGVLIAGMHHPLRLARWAGSIDRLSGGRLTLGLAAGGADLPFEAFGSKRSERGSRLEEGVATLRRAWSGDPQMEPRPVQDPLPVWFGGGGPLALRRTATLADGWIGAGMSSAADFGEQLPRLREELDRAGRDAAAFPVGKRAYVAIDQPPETVDRWFRSTYGIPTPDGETVFTGDAEAVTGRLWQLRQAGADTLVVHAVGDERAQLDVLAERVLPALRTTR